MSTREPPDDTKDNSSHAVSRREFLRKGLQDSARGALKGFTELFGVMGWLSSELEVAQEELGRETILIRYVNRFQTRALAGVGNFRLPGVRLRASVEEPLAVLYEEARATGGDEATVWILPVLSGARAVNQGSSLQLVGVLGPAEAWLVTRWAEHGQDPTAKVGEGLPLGIADRHDCMGQYASLLGVSTDEEHRPDLVELSYGDLPGALAAGAVGAYLVDREELNHLLGYRGQFSVQKVNWTVDRDGAELPAYGMFAGTDFIEHNEELLLRLLETVAELYDPEADSGAGQGSWYLSAAGCEERVMWLLNRALESAPGLIGHRYVGASFVYRGSS